MLKCRKQYEVLMGYYMGGDRDDAGNYTPYLKAKQETLVLKASGRQNISQHLSIEKGVDVPLEFDPDYYARMQEKFGKYSPDYWEWEKLRKYSKAVYSFYRQAIAQFYCKYSLFVTPTRFEEAALNLKNEDLVKLADALIQAEGDLIRQFERNGRTVVARINKYSTLTRLREYAARAWVMWGALNKKFFVSDAVNFKKAYDDLDLSQDLSKLKVFRGCAIMRYNLGGAKSDAIVKKLNRPEEIYAGINSLEVLNELLGKIGAFKTTDYTKLLTNVEVANLTKEYPALMNIYLNYDCIKYIVKMMNYKAQRYNKAGCMCSFAEEIDGNSVDIYLMTCKFCDEIKSVLGQGVDPLFERDLSKLLLELEAALNCAESAYKNE